MRLKGQLREESPNFWKFGMEEEQPLMENGKGVSLGSMIVRR